MRGPLVLALLLTGCAPQRVAGPPAPPVARPAPNLALKWVRTSAEYRALTVQVYRNAAARVETAAASRARGSWAVILDADETILDNSLYAKERGGLPHEDTAWAAWVRRREAGAVPGARAFLDAVRSRGGIVAVVTNRDEGLCDDTRANLQALGLGFDVVLCRPTGGPGDKGARFEDVARGASVPEAGPLEVLAWVGDNIHDFPGGSQALRDAPDEDLAGFGTRFFVLPNPIYGSWEHSPDR